MSIVIAIIVFGVIVLIHEIGHYIAARKCGILVEEFAIGMGPKLWGTQRGDTLFSIRLFPIGGFCKLLGDEVASSDSRAFSNKPLSSRIIVILSGVILNFVLAYVIFTLLSSFGGFALPVVKETIEGYPAETAGLRPGDRIYKINGTKINIYEDLSFVLGESKGSAVDVVVKRGKQLINLNIVPVKDESGSYLIGFTCEFATGSFSKKVETFQQAGLLETLANGFYKILFYIKVIVLSVVRLFTLNLSVKDMSGPIGIVQMIGTTYNETAKESMLLAIANMVNLMGLLSANLAVFNLLPLPALDGGRLVFLIIEGLRGKPVPPEKEGTIHFVGFVLLMLLAVFVAYNDIMKII